MVTNDAKLESREESYSGANRSHLLKPRSGDLAFSQISLQKTKGKEQQILKHFMSISLKTDVNLLKCLIFWLLQLFLKLQILCQISSQWYQGINFVFMFFTFCIVSCILCLFTSAKVAKNDWKDLTLVKFAEIKPNFGIFQFFSPESEHRLQERLT